MSQEVELKKEKHVEYVQDLDSKATRDTFEYWLSEHLRLNGLYWGITSLITLKSLSALPQDEVIKFILQCWDDRTGGFGAFPGHDGHILSTLSGLQILATYGELKALEHRREQVIQFIKSLQLDNGCFQGDRFGEVDTRFVYTAISSLSILGELTPSVVEPAVAFVLRCYNFDGGFGMVPGAESHAAQVFTCLGTLAITDNLHRIDPAKTGTWLSERQVLPSGGFNGRPEKLPDVCYSWWVLSSLAILDKLHWIDSNKLQSFILSCQDLEKGGFSDRPDNQTDVFHTCFGLCGLSLIAHAEYGLDVIDPVYCMPTYLTQTFTKWAR